MHHTLIAFSAILTTLHALTIVQPAAGSTVDPSKPIVVRWTSSASDPATFNLDLTSPSDNASSFSGSKANRLGVNVQTSSGSYTIPANTIAAFGTGFSINANSPNGNILAKSGDFLLGYGVGQVVTGANGQLSLAPSAASTSLESLTFDTSGLTGSVTATYLPSINVSFTGTGPLTTGPAGTSLSSLHFNTSGVTGSMSILPSGSGSRTTSGSTVSSRSSASSSGSASATTNAQPRVGAGKEIMSVAGLLAGLVALIA